MIITQKAHWILLFLFGMFFAIVILVLILLQQIVVIALIISMIFALLIIPTHMTNIYLKDRHIEVVRWMKKYTSKDIKVIICSIPIDTGAKFLPYLPNKFYTGEVIAIKRNTPIKNYSFLKLVNSIRLSNFSFFENYYRQNSLLKDTGLENSNYFSIIDTKLKGYKIISIRKISKSGSYDIIKKESLADKYSYMKSHGIRVERIQFTYQDYLHGEK